MLKAKEHCCEEAAMGMGDAYFPCNKPATKIIRPRKDGGEPDLRMCDACADHSVRNRGMVLLGPYVMPPYAYWKAALAGEKPKMFVDDPQPGFYRSGIYEKQPEKARKRVGWNPVAIFMNGAELAAVVGGTALTDRDRINGLWSYCAAYPISEETYRAVAERGEGWPDSHETDAALSDAAAKPNFPTPEGATGASPESVIAAQLDDCTKQIIKYAKLDSDEMSAKARSLQNKFLDLRGEANKHYEAANRPLLEQQKKLRELWFPLRDLAEAGSVAMRTAMGTWEQIKRDAARAAEEENRKRQEQARLDQERAAASNAPPPPAPDVVIPNTPPPAAQIRGGAGRAAAVSTWNECIVDDESLVYNHLKGNADLSAILLKLAQKATDAGMPVPGTHTVERVKVR